MASAEEVTRKQAPAYPDDPAKRAEQWRVALDEIQRFREHILERTGGKGLPAEELRAALDEADDH